MYLFKFSSFKFFLFVIDSYIRIISRASINSSVIKEYKLMNPIIPHKTGYRAILKFSSILGIKEIGNTIWLIFNKKI